MSEYEPFMVFELDDYGEKNRVIMTEEELESNLHPDQVFVIVREDLRRIFIWKGPKSPVRKRFISSRVASELQEELRKIAAFHRCKIVSVDAGDEPTEFLSAFRLDSMVITERMEDLRYVRNIERDGLAQQGSVVQPSKSAPKPQVEEEYFSPALQETGTKVLASSFKPTPSSPRAKTSYRQPQTTRSSPSISKDQQDKIKDKILKTEVPENHKRLNLILGHTLFAPISKTTKVFGKDVEESVWEPIKQVPAGMIELSNHMLRVYFDEKNGIVEAIEVLERDEGSEQNIDQKSEAKKTTPKKKPKVSKTAPKKKPTVSKTAPKKKPAARKGSLKKKSPMTPMPDKPASMNKPSGRRQLPKIPSTED